MKRRIFAALLALCLAFSLGTVGALASGEDTQPDDASKGVKCSEVNCGHVAAAGGLHYTSLADAIDEVENGGAVTLLGDLALSETIVICRNDADAKAFTLDLGGRTLSASGNSIFHIYHADVTVENGTLDYTGNNVCAVWVCYDGSLNLAAGASIDAGGENGWGVGVDKSATDAAVVINGSITGDHGLTINGNIRSTGTNVKVTVNGTIDVDGYGLYLAGYGTTNIGAGADIDAGVTGVEIRAGVLNVNGGSISGGEELTVKVEPNSGGTTSSGAGIAVAQHTTAQSITVNVNGGTVTGAVAVIQDDPQNNNDSQHVDVNLNGGSFQSKDADYEAVKAANEGVVTITGGVYKNSEGKGSAVDEFLAGGTTLKIDKATGAVVNDTESTAATVNGVGYGSLQAAINAAKPGNTVKLSKSIEADLTSVGPNSGAITIDKAITLDGGGNAISAVGSDGSAKSVVLITADGVKLTRLNVNGGALAQNGINVYNAEDVTLENVIASAKSNPIVVNGSEVTASGLTVNSGYGVNVDNGSGMTGAKFTLLSGSVNAVYTDNDSNAPADIVISGGTVKTAAIAGTGDNSITVSGGHVGAISSSVTNPDIKVTGGSFGMSVKAYADSSLNYEVKSPSGVYAYYATASQAAANADPGSVITYIGSQSGKTFYNVTFYYYNNVKNVIPVERGSVITLPGASRTGYYFDGWTYYGSATPLGAGTRYVVNGSVTFTAVWKNGQYDIFTDPGIKHGEVILSVDSADAGELVHIYVKPALGFKLDSLTVSRVNYSGAWTVPVTYISTGTYSGWYRFTMPAADVYVSAEFEPDGLPFVDVNAYQWFYDGVYYVWSEGLMEGVSDYYFNPGDSMTRAMFWTVLARIDGETITGVNWASQARAWAMREGVSDGTDPNGKVTREQMVTMLWRYLDEPYGNGYLGRFSDCGSVSGWANAAMNWAVARGVIEGVTPSTIEPKGYATRGQCATIFMRCDGMF